MHATKSLGRWIFVGTRTRLLNLSFSSISFLGDPLTAPFLRDHKRGRDPLALQLVENRLTLIAEVALEGAEALRGKNRWISAPHGKKTVWV